MSTLSWQRPFITFCPPSCLKRISLQLYLDYNFYNGNVKLLISIWKLVVHTELIECQPIKHILVNLEGLGVSVTQFLEARRWGRNIGTERYGQREEEWVGKPRGPWPLYLGEISPLPIRSSFTREQELGTQGGREWEAAEILANQRFSTQGHRCWLGATWEVRGIKRTVNLTPFLFWAEVYG